MDIDYCGGEPNTGLGNFKPEPEDKSYQENMNNYKETISTGTLPINKGRNVNLALARQPDTKAMLTGAEIIAAHERGDIHISGFKQERVNPNSYNLTLAPILKVYTRESKNPIKRFFGIKDPLDMRNPNDVKEIRIPHEGLLLVPGTLYLGSTNEDTYTNKYIPMINGRSSTGRLGLCIHITAGFGDIGFDGTWTLEITVVEPLIVYPHTEICQLCWFTAEGETNMQYHGRYQHQMAATPSRMYMNR